MKLILNTLGCPGWELDKVLSVSRTLGFYGIELRGLGDKLNIEDIPELSTQGAEAFKSRLTDNRLHALCLGTSASFHDSQKSENHVIEAKNAIICAYRCNISSIRIFGNNIASKSEEKETADRVITSIKHLCHFSRTIHEQSYNMRSGPVKILLEAHGDFNTTEILSYVCNNVRDDLFGIIWDIAHTDRAFSCGYGNYADFYNKLKKYIHHLHIKDHRKNGDSFTLCSIGNGTIPIKDIILMLKNDGYDGYYSYELEKRWHPELPEPEEEFPRFVEFMRTIQ